MGAFLVGGVRLGFFRRDPGRETVVTGLAADRLFEDESVQEVPRFGGRRVDPVGLALGADQNSPREKRHYPPPEVSGYISMLHIGCIPGDAFRRVRGPALP